ncbi:hypothetical protein KA005_67710, partial [bacterium]|nr:hypothetical protein [bacterium]
CWSKVAGGLGIFWILLLYGAALSGHLSDIFGIKTHMFGFGRIPTYDQKMCDYILDNYPQKRVFTAIHTGGFALLNWYPKKKVFFAGRFASHPADLREDYVGIRTNNNPDLLYEKYGAEFALVEHTRRDWNKIFINSKSWYPAVVGSGTILYAYEPEFPDKDYEPEVIVDSGSFCRSSSFFSKVRLGTLYSVINGLLNKGRTKDAAFFLDNYSDYFTCLSDYSDTEVDTGKKSVLTTLEKARNRYGLVNNENIRFDYLYSVALKEGKSEKIIEYGAKLIELDPSYIDVMFNMALMHFSMNETEKAICWLEKIEEKRKQGHNLQFTTQEQLSKLYYGIASTLEKENQLVKAYDFYSRSHHEYPKHISRDKLYNKGFVFYAALQDKPMGVFTSFDLLKRMLKDFTDNPRLLNELAWLILMEKDYLKVGPEVALRYAQDAVNLMEKRNEHKRLYTVYDTLAEACLQTGDPEKAVFFEKKAIDIAPQDEKEAFRKRMDRFRAVGGRR